MTNYPDKCPNCSELSEAECGQWSESQGYCKTCGHDETDVETFGPLDYFEGVE